MVVHEGRLPLPLVHWLACFIVVWPPDKQAVARGGCGHPTAVSPTAVEWSL
jgi:hypothetical protein